MTKLLLILVLGGAIASGLTAKSQPPLLIDAVQAPPPQPLDAQR
jgi:hypothetical protein